jgi:hypothetical protein
LELIWSGADAIITMNGRDFAAAKRVYHIDILKPGAELARLKAGETS